MKNKSLIIVSILILIVLSCAGVIYWSSNGSKTSTSGTISVEKTVPVVDMKIETVGGKVVVEDKSSPIAGLEIDIPANSYKEAQEFKVSYSPVSSHTFGEYFNPITPLIGVDNGGGYSEEFMQVKIPVKVPADSFAMGFIYDSKTGTLEGLPIISQDENSMTVATRHFTEIIVSLIPDVKLKKDIDTGFRPGMDDWQFVNRGAYTTPDGHCAGQSLSALWYYDNQPDGKDLALYNRYDNNGNDPKTPDLWEDDSLGYRLASTIQNDIDWASFAFKLWKGQRGVNDDLTWKLFSYSMQLTGEPQMVGLTKEGIGGHAMVAYRIKDGDMYIADPNYPGDLTRRINYVQEKNDPSKMKIEPYESGANADEIAKGNSTKYNKIGFTGKTTIIDWNKISERWSEFKDKTIGRDSFPAYAIVWKDDKSKDNLLYEGYVSPEKLIDIYPTSIDAKTSVVVYRDGKPLKWDANGNFELLPGNNKLGIAVWGELDGKDKYIDFQNINVVYEPKETGGLEVIGKNGDWSYSITNINTDMPKNQVKFELESDGKTVDGKKLIVTYSPQPEKKLDKLSIFFNAEGNKAERQWDIVYFDMALEEYVEKFRQEIIKKTSGLTKIRDKWSGMTEEGTTLVSTATANIENMGGASYTGRLCNKMPLEMGSRIIPQSEVENCSRVEGEPIKGGMFFDLSALTNLNSFQGTGKKIFEGYVSLDYSLGISVNINNKAAVKEQTDYNSKYGGGYVEPDVNETRKINTSESLSILEVVVKVE